MKKDAANKDAFCRTKEQTRSLIEQSRSLLRERTALLQKRGTCYETIQKGHTIRQNLGELTQLLRHLQELHKRAQGKRWNAAKNKDELKARYEDIRNLKRFVEELNNDFLSANSGMEVPEHGRASLGLRDAGDACRIKIHAARPEDCTRKMTEQEEETLSRWRERDADLDKDLDAICNGIDRLKPVAMEVGRQANLQSAKLAPMDQDLDKANEDTVQMNKKLTEITRYDKNTNFCCQVVLGVALLSCVGFVFQQLN